MDNEKILYVNGLKSTLDRNKKRGVLIIDPNKVVVDNVIKDRYVKQEDFIVYCSLVVYKNESTSIIEDNVSKEKNIEVQKDNLVYINFLNPVKEVVENNITHKNKFTTDWADFFTSSTDNNNMFDPETFGISSVNVSINASMVPTTTIEFIDVMGKTLFERGNDKNNPYNIFFTFPYPKFLLTFKGYYGTTVEIPLELRTTNTRFDPSTGNYTTTAEFISDIFSLFNSLLLIYAYVAPYMFPSTNTSDTIGKKILNLLYEEQNNKLKDALGEDSSEYKDLEILKSPTMVDLAKAIERIKPLSTSTGGDSSLDEQSTGLISAKQQLINNFHYVSDYFSIDGTEKIINSPEILSLFKNINTTIAQIASSLELGFTDSLYKELNILKTNNKISLVSYKNLLNKGEYIDSSLFFITNSTEYTLEYFDLFSEFILRIIDDAKIKIEDNFIENQITQYGQSLGWKPNLSNVIRIVSNNVQTFLTLLEITSVSAQNQLLTDTNRITANVKSQSIEYESHEGGNKFNRYRPFPNYYTNTIDSGNQQKKDLQYPGFNKINKNWPEVNFVEEIYSAIRRIREDLNIEPTKTIPNDFASLLTSFMLDETDLSSYKNQNIKDILAEHILKFNLFTAHNGTLFRGVDPSQLSNISSSIADFEFDLVRRQVFNNLTALSQYGMAFNFKNLLDSDVNDNRLFNLAKAISTDDFINTFNDSYLNTSINEMRLIMSSSIKSQNEFKFTFNDIINEKEQLISAGLNDNINFYNKIHFDESPLKFTTSTPNFIRDNRLSLNFDIINHQKYYSDNSDILSQLSDIYKSGVSSENYDKNYLQGYIMNLNKLVSNESVNIDFSYVYDIDESLTVPALTFNNDIAYTLELPEPNTNYLSFFNQIAFL